MPDPLISAVSIQTHRLVYKGCKKLKQLRRESTEADDFGEYYCPNPLFASVADSARKASESPEAWVLWVYPAWMALWSSHVSVGATVLMAASSITAVVLVICRRLGMLHRASYRNWTVRNWQALTSVSHERYNK